MTFEETGIIGNMLCLHMAEFVGNGEGGAESVVLTDAAAPVWITHRPQLCKSWITRALLQFS